MYIKVRNLGAKDDDKELFLNISKKAKIQDLRQMIFDEWSIQFENQRLFYKGKQLIDDHYLYEYGIQLNEVVQLMPQCDKVAEQVEENSTAGQSDDLEEKPSESKYYRVNDRVDVRDISGAWFAAKIDTIVHNPHVDETKIPTEEPNLVFKCIQDCKYMPVHFTVQFDDIRPRSKHVYSMDELETGFTVLANYNLDKSNDRGYWYDFKISYKFVKSVKGTLLLGFAKAPLKNITIKLIDEIYKIEKPTLLTERTEETEVEIPLREMPYNCDTCKDKPNAKCSDCGCKVCRGKNNVENILLCDECDDGYHIGCLKPPLKEIPKDPEWYCPECKTDESEIVKAGEKLKASNKKARMPCVKNETNRDWGKGMACVGRTEVCTIVPKEHLGPIPGVEVGTRWIYRHQVSGAGIHRPMVAGIHGRENEYAYSIVLSGGYEDDIDNGDEFYYTGSGGRDLSGNKRVNEQSSDQVLTRMNKAMANNCNAKFNSKEGAEATDWKAGKPVRVVRTSNLSKHSKYAPEMGMRYDGIYKVVKYYPQKGKSGFIVWRYLLRRDDPSPAPWEKGGQEFDIIYPPGYLEAQKQKQLAKEGKKGALKRVLDDTSNIPSPKKIKVEAFKLEKKVMQEITGDSKNSKLWDECLKVLPDGKVAFLKKVEEVFTCICCQEVVYMPITTECKHNMCKSCLRRSFAAGIFSCPYCRFDLGKDFKMIVNEVLGNLLKILFPGYDASR